MPINATSGRSPDNAGVTLRRISIATSFLSASESASKPSRSCLAGAVMSDLKRSERHYFSTDVQACPLCFSVRNQISLRHASLITHYPKPKIHAPGFGWIKIPKRGADVHGKAVPAAAATGAGGAGAGAGGIDGRRDGVVFVVLPVVRPFPD